MDSPQGGPYAHLADYVAGLSGMPFQNANLQGADFRRSDLIEANLTGADLRCADLSEATWCIPQPAV